MIGLGRLIVRRFMLGFSQSVKTENRPLIDSLLLNTTLRQSTSQPTTATVLILYLAYLTILLPIVVVKKIF